MGTVPRNICLSNLIVWLDNRYIRVFENEWKHDKVVVSMNGRSW
jgi:hypothetical protein